MLSPSAATLLEVWQRATAVPAAERPIALLAALTPGSETVAAEQIEQLPIGERDGRLFHLRESIFGSLLTSIATCPGCTVSLEFTLDARTLATAPPNLESDPLTVSVDGQEARFRLPNSEDMAAVSALADLETARMALLRRCVVSISGDDTPTLPLDLSEDLARRVGERMGAADPRAHIELDLTCPACGERWSTVFDIAAYLWIELTAWARRILTEVHCLARAYGWSESAILALPPERRRLYMELAAS